MPFKNETPVDRTVLAVSGMTLAESVRRGEAEAEGSRDNGRRASCC